MGLLGSRISAAARRSSGGSGPFKINLSGIPPVPIGPLRMVLILGAVGLLCGMAWDIWRSWQADVEAARVRPAIERINQRDRDFLARARQEGVDLSDGRLARLPNEVAFANRLIAERAFSWTQLLMQLEQTVPEGVALSGIQHDLKDTIRIRMTGFAQSLEAVTTFTLALGEHQAFYDPLLIQHRMTSDGERVDFNLNVGYRWEQL